MTAREATLVFGMKLLFSAARCFYKFFYLCERGLYLCNHRIAATAKHFDWIAHLEPSGFFTSLGEVVETSGIPFAPEGI